MSKILTAINKTGEYRMHIAVTTDICREVSKIHRTFPVATAALGRTLTAATMISTELKSEETRLSIIIKGESFYYARQVGAKHLTLLGHK